jgi:hypothetical protein
MTGRAIRTLWRVEDKDMNLARSISNSAKLLSTLESIALSQVAAKFT